jgi:predicted metal-dependent peptidase
MMDTTIEAKPLTPAEEARLGKRLSKAKTGLVLEHPFIGNIAMNLPFKLDNTLNPPTACVDGKTISFHPEFVDELNDEELKFLVAHECMHPMLEHCFRRGSRNHKKWNQAGDYVINKLLVDESIGKMPSRGLHNDALYQAGNGTTDGIYNLLPEPDEDGNNGHGDALDNCADGASSPAEQAQQQAEWKVRVAQAAQSAKMMGKMSAGLERLVGDLLAPKVDWRDVLRKFVEKAKNDTRSFARPNRRFISQGLYLPSISGESLGEMLIAVDCSGSITDEVIAQFASEIHTIKEDGNPTRIHVVYFDSEVSHYDKYERDDELDIKAHGGGGTAFSPVFQYARDNDIEPVACIFLTDLCCDDFGDEPPYPVLWVSTDEGTAPFGEVVLMGN